jgi:GDP-4-dehydro-6-deoxy-D-mannose reductase
MKVFVTGATGFAGSHLLEYLEKRQDLSLFGTFLSSESLVNIEKVKNRIKLFKVDLGVKDEVERLIKEVEPDVVFHLAAFTAPSESFKDPLKPIENNVSIELNIFEALKSANLFKTKTLITSSGEVYGLVAKENLPIDEETPFNPTNPYAVSKITQDFLALQYFLSYNMPIIRVRPFNHIGPRQSPSFVIASFAKKIAEIEKGKEPILEVGNLEAKRDFTDVRDMVKAYSLAVEKGLPGEVYNIGSGKSYKISEMLEYLLSLSSKKIQVKESKSLLRPIDNPELVCDFSKFKKETGWSPKVDIHKTLEDTLDYWRQII